MSEESTPSRIAEAALRTLANDILSEVCRMKKGGSVDLDTVNAWGLFAKDHAHRLQQSPPPLKAYTFRTVSSKHGQGICVIAASSEQEAEVLLEERITKQNKLIKLFPRLSEIKRVALISTDEISTENPIYSDF